MGGDAPPEGARDGDTVPTFAMMVRRLRREAREGRTMPWALTYQRRAGRPGHRRRHRLGVPARRLHRLLDRQRGRRPGHHADRRGDGLRPLLRHPADCTAIEINIRPENAASLRVVEKLGLRREGERAAYLHIDGDWRDHVTYVVYAGDFPDGVLAAYRRASG